VDLVFNTGVKEKRYGGVKDPAEDGGADLADFRSEYGIGRIYRLIYKLVNVTGKRIQSFKVEVGTGVGGDFEAFDFAQDGVAYEMRQFVPREFFEGRTGAPDREVWDPSRFATFSPKLFDDGVRPRFDPGFLDNQAAGFFPPQDIEGADNTAEKTQFIDSGQQTDALGKVGSLTSNYFDMANNQALGAGIAGTPFGYMLPEAMAPTAIARYDEGDPTAESDAIVAWWDGQDWRYGQNNAFGIVPESQLQQWAALPLGLEGPATPERYEAGLSDDVSSMNVDSYLYLGEKMLDDQGAMRFDNVTIRITARSVENETVAGTETPEWMKAGNEAPSLGEYMVDDGQPVAINDYAETLETDPVSLDLDANDLLDGDPLPSGASLTITQDPSNGSYTVDNTENAIEYTADEDFFGTDTLKYTVTLNEGTVDEVTSNEASVEITVEKEPSTTAPVANNDSGVTLETAPLDIDVLANDTKDGVPVLPEDTSIEIVDQPLSGTAAVNPDGTITYTANAGSNFTFSERFTYRIAVDGLVSNTALVTVRADSADDDAGAPVTLPDQDETVTGEPVTINVLANDSKDGLMLPENVAVTLVTGPANGSLTLNPDNTVTYTPDPGFVGTDTFTYRVTVDGLNSSEGTVSVTVGEDGSTSLSSSSDDEVFGCTIGGGGFDPLLPGLLLLILVRLGWRRRAGMTA
jgi:hypothetical protein